MNRVVRQITLQQSNMASWEICFFVDVEKARKIIYKCCLEAFTVLQGSFPRTLHYCYHDE